MTALRWPGAEDLFQLPFRRLFSTVDRPSNENDEIVTAFTNGEVTLRRNRDKVGYHEAADTSTYRGVRRGDFVVHGLDIMRGSVGISDSDGVISSVCTVCRPKGLINPSYAAYVMRLQAQDGYPKALARGVREGGADFRRWDTLAELPLPVPDIETQTKIVEFLNRETARMDYLVSQIELLVSLLVEKRAKLVSEAVTRGIDSSADLKDSDVQWLGKIPSNWDVIRARYLCTVNTGTGDTIDATESGDYPFYVRSDIPQLSDKYDYDTEAVLTSGDGAGVGKVFHLVKGKFRAHQRVYVLNDFKGISPEFFFWYFSSYFGIVALDGSAKSTVDSVRRHMITDMPIAVPDPQEQKVIVDYIHSRTAEIDNAMYSAIAVRKLIRERKHSLITAAVTCKLKEEELE